LKYFGYDFELLDEHHLRDLLHLEREGALYADHWIERLSDFRHIRIKLTPNEIQEYVRSLWAYELFLRAGHPERASDVGEIPKDIAERADSYRMVTEDGVESEKPWHCVAGFLDPELERLTCLNVEGRQEIIEETGKAQLITTIKKAVDSLTPSIRLFNRREKGLSQWPVSREDDVRDLLYVMLRAAISDIKTEEPVPSRAGTHKFIDIYSQIARLFIELKWIGKKGTWKQVLKQINDDIQSYVAHPCCDTLIFIVIDEAKDIPDPALVERDYTGWQTIGDKEIDIHLYVREP
jgi:hypothetical protein